MFVWVLMHRHLGGCFGSALEIISTAWQAPVDSLLASVSIIDAFLPYYPCLSCSQLLQS